jgi:Nitroreductase
MHEQHGRNYQFFDAPVGLFFTMDRVMERGSLLDYGMFLQNIMVMARTYGLSTCPQAAFMKYHKIIERELHLKPEEMFVVGMSLGFADESRIENSLVSEREPSSSFAVFHST